MSAKLDRIEIRRREGRSTFDVTLGNEHGAVVVTQCGSVARVLAEVESAVARMDVNRMDEFPHLRVSLRESADR